MLAPLIRCWAFVALTLLIGAPLQAAGTLDQLPVDATAFVIVHNMSATSGKIERVAAIFQEVVPMPLPAPLQVVKAAAGLGPGLNEQGDALLALLPGQEAPFPPRPLLLVAVADYAAFAQSLGGDASGEICRVTIAGEEVLIAKRGDYAALMNVEHRDRLEEFLAAEPQSPTELAPLAEWLATTDVAAGLTQRGLEALTALAKGELAALQAEGEEQLGDPQTAEMMRQMQQSLQAYNVVLNFLGTEVKAGAVGLSIDEENNMRLAKRVLLKPEGWINKLAGAKPLEQSPLARHPAKPFVLAAGGPLSSTYADLIAQASRRFLEQMPDIYGYQDFTEEDWNKLEESYRDSMTGIRSMSVVLYAGEADDALMSNYYFMFDVDDSQAYLGNFRKSLELQNDLFERSSINTMFSYEFQDVQIDGKPALEATADMLKAADDQNVPMVGAIMKAMFGEDGKMRMYAVAADAHTVVTGIALQDRMAEAVKFVVSGDAGLGKQSGFATTAALLDPNAPWVAAISPQGVVIWATRWINLFFAQFGGGAPNIPEFPETPPVGFSFNLVDAQFQAEMVWPVDSLKGIVAYVKKVEGTE